MIKIKPLKIYSAVASLLAASNIADALASMGCKYVEWSPEKKIPLQRLCDGEVRMKIPMPV
jgi:hypothetical protein